MIWLLLVLKIQTFLFSPKYFFCLKIRNKKKWTGHFSSWNNASQLHDWKVRKIESKAKKYSKKYFSTLSNLWGIYIQYTFEWKIVLPAVYIMGKLSSCTFSLLHDKDNMHGPLTRLVYCEENGFRNDFLFSVIYWIFASYSTLTVKLNLFASRSY